MNEQKKERPEDFPCTECGGDAYLGYTDWSNRKGETVVKAGERLCTNCFNKRIDKDHEKLPL